MVGRRAREFALRMALGATRGQIAAEIAWAAGTLTITGGAGGTLLAVLFSRVLSGWLTGVRLVDIIAYSSPTAVLLLAALLACVIPGRRAALINPTEALREQWVLSILVILPRRYGSLVCRMIASSGHRDPGLAPRLDLPLHRLEVPLDAVHSD